MTSVLAIIAKQGTREVRSPDVSMHSTFILSFAVQTQEISLLSRSLRILCQPFLIITSPTSRSLRIVVTP